MWAKKLIEHEHGVVVVPMPKTSGDIKQIEPTEYPAAPRTATIQPLNTISSVNGPLKC